MSYLLIVICSVIALLFFPYSSYAQLECVAGETKPCGSNVGACSAGNRTCKNGTWSECRGAIQPVPEICGNGIDDNCNGQTDECTFTVSFWLVFAGIGILIFAFLFALSKSM